MDGGSRGGTRDNGLRCANYVAIADVDPRVVGTLLDALRDAGIAAYASPAAGAVGGAMETRLPSRPVDRLWVDDQQVARAREVVEAEERDDRPAVAAPPGAPGLVSPADLTTGATETADIDAAWQQVLASLQSPSAAPVPPWPVSEDVDGDSEAESGRTSYDVESADGEPEEDEHYVPPPPPPFPRLQRATVGALVSIAAGLVVLGLQIDGGSLTPLAIIAILGGVASLIWRMRNGPPTDSGWDDGAVV